MGIDGQQWHVVMTMVEPTLARHSQTVPLESRIS